MPSFGEKLKLEREKRKVTLEQISVSTKIGTRMLQALEEDKFSQLPGGIFNKGFVRAYARCVGLDEDQTVADYLQASGDAPPVSVEIVAHDNKTHENEASVRRIQADADVPARQMPWGVFAAGLLVVALTLSLWSHRQREQKRQSVQPSAATSENPSPVQDAVASSPTSVPPAPSIAAAGSPTATAPAPAPAPSGAPQTPGTATGTVPAKTGGEFTVAIRSREQSWISITTDGEVTSSELLTAGSERISRGRKEIVVKAGNAGGVDFLFNGNKLETGGEYGEVKTVTFGPRGILKNASTPPSTP